MSSSCGTKDLIPDLDVVESDVKHQSHTHTPDVDLTKKLPEEVLLLIFSLLDTPSLSACSQTCRSWNSLICQSETIWKLQCLTLKDSLKLVEKDRKKGKSWKDTFQKNYGLNGLKRSWKLGKFSNPRSYHELPDKPLCRLDTESWGQILQWELDRS